MEIKTSKYPKVNQVLAKINQDPNPVSVSDLCVMFNLPASRSAASAIRTTCHVLANKGLINEEKVYIKDNIFKYEFSPKHIPQKRKLSKWAMFKNTFLKFLGVK